MSPFLLTFGGDGEHRVRRGRAVHVGGVPDGAGVGAVVLQGGVDQRDGGVAPSRSSLPGDPPSKPALQGREGPGGEVEELQRQNGEVSIFSQRSRSQQEVHNKGFSHAKHDSLWKIRAYLHLQCWVCTKPEQSLVRTSGALVLLAPKKPLIVQMLQLIVWNKS